MFVRPLEEMFQGIIRILSRNGFAKKDEQPVDRLKTILGDQ